MYVLIFVEMFLLQIIYDIIRLLFKVFGLFNMHAFYLQLIYLN